MIVILYGPPSRSLESSVIILVSGRFVPHPFRPLPFRPLPFCRVLFRPVPFRPVLIDFFRSTFSI